MIDWRSYVGSPIGVGLIIVQAPALPFSAGALCQTWNICQFERRMYSRPSQTKCSAEINESNPDFDCDDSMRSVSSGLPSGWTVQISIGPFAKTASSGLLLV